MRHTATGIGIAGFLLAQVSDVTAPAALPALALGGLAATFRDELDLTQSLDPVEWSLTGLVAACLVAAWVGSDFAASLALSVPLAAFVLIIVMLRRSVRADDDIRLAITSLSALAACAFVLTCAAFARGQPATGPWVVVPNDVCWVAAAMPWITRRFGGTRVMIATIAIATFVLAMLAESRLALLVLAGSAGLAIDGSRRLRIALGLTAAALATAGVILLAKGTASLGARGELAAAAVRLGLESPLTGIGPHRFAAHYLDVVDVPTLVDQRLTPWPHSLPLELWAETGALGIVAVLALIYCAGRCSRSQSWGDYEQATRGVIGGFAIAAAFEASTLRVWTWMLAALVIAIIARRPAARVGNDSRSGE